MTLASTLAAASGPPAPGPHDFNLPSILPWNGSTSWGVNFGLEDGFFISKPMVLVVLSLIIVIALFAAAARPAAVVPGRLQFAGELVYGFVRDGIARDNLGSKDYQRFVPFLFAIFAFVFVNNYYGLVPFVQFPVMSHIGFPLAIALVTWVIYNGAGIARHGFVGYLKHETVPGGMKGPILLLLVPLEFLSNILLRPITLTLRLFATMFAGHLLLVLFSLGAGYLLLHSDNPLAIPAGIASGILFVAISCLELLVMFLQAYVFTLLAAMYIGEALADEH
ncbi:MAG: F0F1 ATP synthase subunit A [Aeromicrobium sp.]|uniref:F0F1 ATP synthase subunit A n=1 Tax=Aeromicrobium sp. TaxID=1871063 RepID=UPI0039E6EA90